MKVQLETISQASNKSYHLMYNPRLSHLFYWHFHPEYELVYIQGTDGTRHVGDHISTYIESDLVLIGSNIPHLNFDYGVKSDYKKIVLHLNPSFVQENIQHTPELKQISALFQKSQYGIAFHSHTKKELGERLYNLDKEEGITQYLELLSILASLAESEEYELLHPTVYKNKFTEKEQSRLRKIHEYIDKHYQQKIKLEEVASISNLSKEAFCRYFKKNTGSTFVDFLNQYRVTQAKRILMSGKTVSDACFSCGFESLSYFNRVFKKLTDQKPSFFRKRYLP